MSTRTKNHLISFAYSFQIIAKTLATSGSITPAGWKWKRLLLGATSFDTPLTCCCWRIWEQKRRGSLTWWTKAWPWSFLDNNFVRSVLDRVNISELTCIFLFVHRVLRRFPTSTWLVVIPRVSYQPLRYISETNSKLGYHPIWPTFQACRK